MKRRLDRQRQHFAEQIDDDKWQRGAGRKANDRADHSQHDHLRQVDRKHVAAGGADRLEGCNHVAAPIDMALDRVGDADAANQKRRKSYERQKLGEAADRAFELRRSIVAIADLPAGVRKRLPRIVDEPRGVAAVAGVVRQFDPIGPAHQAARLQQLRGAKSGLADQESRSESEAAGKLVGFAIIDAADLKGRTADIDAIAELQVEPGQQRLIGRNAECAIAFGQQIGDRHIRLERELAEHRVGAVDRLDLDQRQAAIGRARHAAQRGDRRDLAARTKEIDFLGLGFALEQRKSDVTTEQRAALARQSVAKTCGHRTDAGNRHDAERDAGDEDIEAAQAATQFAHGVAQRNGGRPAIGSRCFRNDRHEAASRSAICASMWPERSRTTRSQRCASAVS